MASVRTHWRDSAEKGPNDLPQKLIPAKHACQQRTFARPLDTYLHATQAAFWYT